MDTIKQLGELALGSRLKRLSDHIMKEGAIVYKHNNIDFEPKWFPVYHILSTIKETSIMEISREIGITHPSVSQIVKEMNKNGLITIKSNQKDKRRKLISLSKKGSSLLPKMEPIWKDISQAIHELNTQHQHNILCATEEFESDLNQTNLSERVAEITKNRLLDEVEIIDFEPKHAGIFKQLNEEWITRYFTLEEEDIHILDNPLDSIIKPGGHILLASYHQEIVGTCSLLKIDKDHYEMVKMAVTAKCQGKQIGKKLGLATIDRAKACGAKRITLETNKILTPAINLYHKLGFMMSSDDHCASVYERCDVQMELNL
ncbi:MAG: bifunctional helix-turn-helix transcriptional regulator/GNAT family N-acetyltransferase [Cyclobacteriaceae bacterium]